MSELRDLLHLAIRAAMEAGRIQQRHVGGPLEIDTKSTDTDLVTHVDRLCETRIREIIAEAHPDHAVWGEEEGQGEANRASGHRWIVDPIDGTLNYAHGLPFYCTSIGLEIDGAMAVGVVYDATRDELFSAVRGRGAYLNGRPLRVTGEAVLKRAMLITGFAYDEDRMLRNVEVMARMLPKARTVRRLGAGVLDLCYVAAGRADGFWELGLQPWDVAAAMLVVQEAGGLVTGGDGEPYRFGDEALVASNGALHAALVRELGLPDVVARGEAHR